MSLFDKLHPTTINGQIKFVAEDEDGYTEYKLTLLTKTKHGLKKIISQLIWRLENGKELLGSTEAHYVLGINDDGSLGKLTESDVDKSFIILMNIIEENQLSLTQYEKKQFDDSFMIYSIIKKIEKEFIKELNIVFVGPSQHGKTTLISNLSYGQLDDGNGYNRKFVLKHDHEKHTGLTSSIKKEIIGITKNNKIINYCVGIRSSWENIVTMSDIIVNLIDLPCNKKFIKSLLFGLSVYDIDVMIFVCNINELKQYDQLIKFYSDFCSTLNIQLILVLSHCDDNSFTEYNNTCDYVTIPLSNTTGMGLDVLQQNIINISKIKQYYTTKINESSLNIFRTIEMFFVPDSKTIFSGIVQVGKFDIGQDVIITNGTDQIQSKILSIQKKQINSYSIYNGETGTIELDKDISLIEWIDKHTTIVDIVHRYSSKDILNLKIISSIKYDSNIQKNTLFINNSVMTFTIMSSFDDNIIISLDKPILLLSTQQYAFIKTITDLIFCIIIDDN